MGLFDRWFGKKPPPPPPPPLDVSETNLRAVLGDANVMIASGLALASTPASQPGRDQVGGVPANIGAEQWPVCEQCACLMTFVAQLAVGPDEELRYPERGSLALFVCNSERPDAFEPCATFEAGRGNACFFVDDRPAPPMFTDAQRDAIAAAIVRAHESTNPRAIHEPFLLPPIERVRGRPVLDHAYRVERRRVVSCRAPRGDRAAVAHVIAASAASGVALEIGGFPDWIQGPMDDGACSCGGPMELLVQFGAFDDALNFGEGLAYVLACTARCGPRSFALAWAC